MFIKLLLLKNLVQRWTANPPMERMVAAQKIFSMGEDPGMWGQPWRLVLSQKAEKMLMIMTSLVV